MIFSEFLDNESTKRYYEIIENARLFPIPVDTYTEKHHIIPKSFYKSKDKSGWLVGTQNSPDNFVILTGHKHSAETKAKMSKARLGKPGHIPSDDAKAKMSKACLGNKNGLGYKHSEESKAKMSKAALERKPHSIETKAKMSKALSNRIKSEESI